MSANQPLFPVLIFCGYVVFIAQMYTGYLLLGEPGYFVHQYNLKMKNMVSTSYVRRPDTWPVMAF
jgi:hypothetical protein